MSIKINILNNSLNIKSTIKPFVSAIFLSLTLVSNNVFSDTQVIESPSIESANIEQLNSVQAGKLALMAKLAKFEFFSANFTQLVSDTDGNKLQETQGTIDVIKPNLVNWHTVSPDESIIISDGETLWFFDPFIEQVTAYQFDKSIANTPILLLTSNDEALWQHYGVTQINDNDFLVHSLDSNSQIQTLEIIFNELGFTQLIILDATGQFSRIFIEQANFTDKPAMSKFEFILPEGIELDDQR